MPLSLLVICNHNCSKQLILPLIVGVFFSPPLKMQLIATVVRFDLHTPFQQQKILFFLHEKYHTICRSLLFEQQQQQLKREN